MFQSFKVTARPEQGPPRLKALRAELAAEGLAGFLIPFVFVYHPAMLYKLQVLFIWFGGEMPKSNAMIDLATVTWADLGWIMVAFTLSMWLLASAMTGFEKNR